MRKGQFADISDAAGVNEMRASIAEIDQSLADVGVQLQPSMSYHYDSPTEPPAAIEAPKKARKPRAPKADAKPAPKRAAKGAAKAPAKAVAAKAVVAKAPAPRKPRAKKASA